MSLFDTSPNVINFEGTLCLVCKICVQEIISEGGKFWCLVSLIKFCWCLPPESILLQRTSNLSRNSDFRDFTILSGHQFCERMNPASGSGKFAIAKINLDYFARRWRRSYIFREQLQNLATWFNSRGRRGILLCCSRNKIVVSGAKFATSEGYIHRCIWFVLFVFVCKLRRKNTQEDLCQIYLKQYLSKYIVWCFGSIFFFRNLLWDVSCLGSA